MAAKMRQGKLAGRRGNLIVTSDPDVIRQLKAEGAVEVVLEQTCVQHTITRWT